MKKTHKGTIEGVKEILLTQMGNKPNIFCSSVMSIPLTDARDGYDINVFSSKYSKRVFGFMIGNSTSDAAIGLFQEKKLDIQESSSFAYMVISELFPVLTNEYQQKIIKSFLKSIVDSLIQDHDSSNHLWGIIDQVSMEV